MTIQAKKLCVISHSELADSGVIDLTMKNACMQEALVSLLRLCLSSVTFYYNGTIYQQIFGTAMESPVSVVVANIIMEDLALSTSPVPTIFWKRYVNDVLTAVQADQADGMLAHINSINQNIQFTSEREQGPCLDVTILHNGDGFLSTKMYCKPTHTDQYLQFSSHHPTAHKRGVVSTLLKRAAPHCSMNSLVREERSYVKETLHQNGYTQSISSLISAHHLGRTERRRMIVDPMSPFHTFQGVSEAVTRILSNINAQVHMKPFRTLRRILFHPKDRIPDDKSSVVYKINYHDCDASYVGETGRALKTRMSKHRRAVEKAELLRFCSSTACMGAQPSH